MPSATGTATTRIRGRQQQKRKAITESWVGRVPQIKPGTHADGIPYHQVQYLCCKLILKRNKFVSRESRFEFGEVMREPCWEHEVKFSVAGWEEGARRER